MQNSSRAYPAVELEHGVTTVLEGPYLEYLSDEMRRLLMMQQRSSLTLSDENNQELEQELEELFGDAGRLSTTTAILSTTTMLQWFPSCKFKGYNKGYGNLVGPKHLK
eukprot:6012907-Amphidinium_carterae.1